MSINTLSTEILQKIYEYSDLEDVVHLAQASRRTYRVFLGRRLYLLQNGLHNSFAPLPSLLKLVLANEPDKGRRPIGTEIRINNLLERIVLVGPTPKLTLEHMKKMVEYGRIAEKWTEIYPRLRWRFGSDNRRLLHAHEKERLRRAVYHHWTYSTLFHSRTYTAYSPDPPSNTSVDDPRHRLLRTYSTIEHIQLSEYLAHIEQLVSQDLYPSNSIVQEHYSHSLPPKQLIKLAWGEGNTYRRLVRDIMKLSPADLLHLVENTNTKTERADFLFAKEACFGDVPATLNYALSSVTHERAVFDWFLSKEQSVFFNRRATLCSLKLVRGEEEGEEVDLIDGDLAYGIVDAEKEDESPLALEVEKAMGSDGVSCGTWAGAVAKLPRDLVSGADA